MESMLKSLSVQAEHRCDCAGNPNKEIRTSDAQLQDVIKQSNVAGKQLEVT